MEQKLAILVNDALQLHFKKLTKYKLENMIINEMNESDKIDNSKIIVKNNLLTFPQLDRIYKKEIFGIYVNKYNTFSWGWALPPGFYDDTSILIKKLFDTYYKKNIETKFDYINFFLRNIFITSRINVKNIEEITIIIALAEYVLKDIDNFKFIFPLIQKLSDDPDDYIITYYCAKY
jgi:hypothetical protein